MQISVTQEDISAGVRQRAGRCPVSLAMSREFKKQIVVGCGWWCYKEFTPPIATRYFTLDEKVAAWVLKFDLGEKVEPMEFEA